MYLRPRESRSRRAAAAAAHPVLLVLQPVLRLGPAGVAIRLTAAPPQG